MPVFTHAGVDLHLEEAGVGVGPPVLLLHSGIGSGRDWRAAGGALPGDPRRLLPDLHFRGRSGPWTGPGPYGLAREAEAMAALIAAHGGAAHVVGHSFGGAVAARLAVDAPEAVLSLTLAEPQVPGLLADLDPGALAALEAVYAERLPLFADGRSAEGWAWFVDLYNGPGAWARFPAGARARLATLSPVMAPMWRTLVDDGVRASDLSGLRVPTLVLTGAETLASERAMTRAVAVAIPGARLEEVAGAAHMLPLTHPEEVGARIGAFLARPAPV